MNTNGSSDESGARPASSPHRLRCVISGARSASHYFMVLVAAVLLSCSSDVQQGDVVVPHQSDERARAIGTFLNGTVKHFQGRIVTSVTLSADLSTVAASYTDGFFATWKIPDNKPFFTRELNEPGPGVRLSSDGKVIAAQSSFWSYDFLYDELEIWHAPEPDQYFELRTRPRDQITSFWFAADDSILMSIRNLDDLSSSLYFLDKQGVTRGEYIFPTASVTPQPGSAGQTAFNPDTQEYVVSANWSKEDYTNYSGYMAWKPGTAPRLVPLECNTNGSFSEDGRLFACDAGPDGAIVVWNVTEGREVTRWQGIGDSINNRAEEMTFFDRGRGLAVEQGTHDKAFRLITTIRLYSISSHQVLREYDLEPIEKRPDLVASSLGNNDILLYMMNFSQNTGESNLAFYAFPTPISVR